MRIAMVACPVEGNDFDRNTACTAETAWMPVLLERLKEGNSMNDELTQDQRLTKLVEDFKTDSGEYKDIETPGDTDGGGRFYGRL